MKRSVYLYLLAGCLTLSVTGTGCKKKPKGPTPIPSGRTAPGTGTETFGPDSSATPLPAETGIVGNPVGGFGPGNGDLRTGEGYQIPSRWDPELMDQDRSPLQGDTVYFDYDRSAVKTSERGKLESVAGYLNSNPAFGVLVEGHCDERGTEQYNLSLGERRALAVREYLINLGVDGQRVHSISFGEARPADMGHDETAWARNRRADFVVLKPKR